LLRGLLGLGWWRVSLVRVKVLKITHVLALEFASLRNGRAGVRVDRTNSIVVIILLIVPSGI
jgi:hypothetical protein